MQKRAFTLLELSLVVLIISILVVGSMTASISTINKAKYKSTKEKIDVIYHALGNYLVTNGALPCPAPITMLDSNPLYGISGSGVGVCNSDSEAVYDGGTNLVYGMVPIQDLNLPADLAKDGFGTKFTYVVNVNFTDRENTVYVGNDSGNITITEAVASGSQTLTSNAVFVVISHGENKYGGYNSNSATQNPDDGDSNERQNYRRSSSYDNNFTLSAINSEDFDDLVFYKTRNQMIVDFDAFELIDCEAISGVLYPRCSGGSCDWPQSRYNQIVPSSTNCSTSFDTTVQSPTKRCGAFGSWDIDYVNPCTN